MQVFLRASGFKFRFLYLRQEKHLIVCPPPLFNDHLLRKVIAGVCIKNFFTIFFDYL